MLSSLTFAHAPHKKCKCEFPVASDLLHTLTITNYTGDKFYVRAEVICDGDYAYLDGDATIKGHPGRPKFLNCIIGATVPRDATTSFRIPVYLRPHTSGERPKADVLLTIKIFWDRRNVDDEDMTFVGQFNHPFQAIA
jgi:hypothetical protein